MSDVAVVLAVMVLCLIAVLALVSGLHSRERLAWAKERKQLVDRVIARHAGEVIALDREPKPKVERDPASTVFVEGLS